MMNRHDEKGARRSLDYPYSVKHNVDIYKYAEFDLYLIKLKIQARDLSKNRRSNPFRLGVILYQRRWRSETH